MLLLSSFIALACSPVPERVDVMYPADGATVAPEVAPVLLVDQYEPNDIEVALQHADGRSFEVDHRVLSVGGSESSAALVRLVPKETLPPGAFTVSLSHAELDVALPSFTMEVADFISSCEPRPLLIEEVIAGDKHSEENSCGSFSWVDLDVGVKWDPATRECEGDRAVTFATMSSSPSISQEAGGVVLIDEGSIPADDEVHTLRLRSDSREDEQCVSIVSWGLSPDYDVVSEVRCDKLGGGLGGCSTMGGALPAGGLALGLLLVGLRRRRSR